MIPQTCGHMDSPVCMYVCACMSACVCMYVCATDRGIYGILLHVCMHIFEYICAGWLRQPFCIVCTYESSLCLYMRVLGLILLYVCVRLCAFACMYGCS